MKKKDMTEMMTNVAHSDIFNMHEGVFTKEKNNISGLPSVADIEIHRSPETGKFYLKFIEWFSGWNEGSWQEQEIPEDAVRLLLTLCYPDHITQVMRADLGKGVET